MNFGRKVIYGDVQKFVVTPDEPEEQIGPQPLTPYSFDRESFRRKVAYNESRGSKEPYRAKSEKAHKDGSHDWGKYQANENTIREWSGPWLDKQHTVESFTADPEAQEQFFEEYMNMAENHELSPDEAAITWHRGWGALGNQADKPRRREIMKEQKKRYMSDPENLKYLTTFRNAP